MKYPCSGISLQSVSSDLATVRKAHAFETESETESKRMASSSRTPLDSALALAGFFLLCFAVAGFGAHSAAPFIHTWYRGLVKPSFSPSPRIFAPAWFVTYSVMAISAWMVWRMPRRRARSSSYQGMNEQGSARLDALIVFYIQLALNAFWMPLFFHYHRLLVSVVAILVLWIAIFFTILLFWRVKPAAGALMLPYLGVVSYATALNLVLLHLN
jgi:translocator protein